MHVAIGIIERTRCGYMIAHSSDLHPAHRAADDGVPAVDAEVVGEPGLGAHHVADRDHREARAVRAAVDGVRRRRPGRALAAAEHVRAHDEPAVGVDRPARTDHPLPPARRRVPAPGRAGDVAVAGPGVAQQDGVGRRARRACPTSRRRPSRRTGPSRSQGERRPVERQELRDGPGGSPGSQAPVTRRSDARWRTRRHRRACSISSRASRAAGTLRCRRIRPHPARAGRQRHLGAFTQVAGPGRPGRSKCCPR